MEHKCAPETVHIAWTTQFSSIFMKSVLTIFVFFFKNHHKRTVTNQYFYSTSTSIRKKKLVIFPRTFHTKSTFIACKLLTFRSISCYTYNICLFLFDCWWNMDLTTLINGKRIWFVRPASVSNKYIHTSILQFQHNGTTVLYI